MPKVISIHTDQSIREWVPSPLAPRSGLRLMPAALTVPNLRTFDSTDSWSPQTKWPSTPAPEESSSQQAENTADLITSDDPWYLDAAAKLMLERVPQSISHDQPDFEVLYEFLKNCSDTRLPLELFALAINLMEVFPRNGSWMGRWMESRPEHGTVHEHDDCLPEGDPIPSSQGSYLPSYFRPLSETPPPPAELFALAILACANSLLAASAHPFSKNYNYQKSAYWAILVSRGRFGANQIRTSRDLLWSEMKKLNQEQVWAKMHRRMDQIERHAARTMKEEAEDEGEGTDGGSELHTMLYGMHKMRMDDAGGYEGTGQDWEEDNNDSGGNRNAKVGTEDTRSVTVYGWLDGVE